MKKLKLFSVILFFVAIVAFASFKVYENITEDTTAPEIYCQTDEITVSVTATEEDLLAGMTAKDDKSGDLTESLVIERISPFLSENTRTITYAVIDESGNVARYVRTLHYKDYEKPKFASLASARFPIGKDINMLGYISAYSPLDGDLTDKIKYTLSDSVDLDKTGTTKVEISVMDSTGTIVYLPIELELYNSSDERIKVNLKEYLIYVNLGDEFRPGDYYEGSDIKGNLSMESNVDTSVPGVYYVDYIVKSDMFIGKNRLIVIVE